VRELKTIFKRFFASCISVYFETSTFTVDQMFRLLALAAVVAGFSIAVFNLLVEKPEELHDVSTKSTLKLWPFVRNMWNPNDNLRSVKRVMTQLNHEIVDGLETDDWDILWSIEYPFNEKYRDKWQAMKPHQRVNHFPGIRFLTNKKYMTTNNSYPFIPAAFIFPSMLQKFQNFVEQNPGKKFVRKNQDNRGVQVVSLDDIDYTQLDFHIIQQFIENPLLIDGFAFDMGVYVLVTSLNPLRIYRFTDEVLLRFCPKLYHPFDPNDIDKYVVYESQQTIVEIPSLRRQVVELKKSFKTSFESHLKATGFNTADLWRQVDEAIVTLCLANEQNILNVTESFGKVESFFELVRFDFIIDDTFKVHLMEINMSPNLTPSADRFEIHGPGYEKVIHDALECAVGIEGKKM
jgi:tubulin monoglycylase TTLL15